MEEAKEIKLLNTIKTKIIGWIVGSLLTAIVGLTAFYFNTNYVTAQNTTTNKEQSLDIKKIKDDVSKIKTVPVINQLQIKVIKEDVKRIERSTDKMNDKIDKMIEILIEIKTKSK